AAKEPELSRQRGTFPGDLPSIGRLAHGDPDAFEGLFNRQIRLLRDREYRRRVGAVGTGAVLSLGARRGGIGNERTGRAGLGVDDRQAAAGGPVRLRGRVTAVGSK